jgi:intracellular sulfur oxidation DsrE/DsrF family protein
MRSLPILLMSMLMSLLIPTQLAAADWSPQTGPVIAGRGPWVPVETTWSPPEGHHFRVVFDIATATEDPADGSREIESAARYINMQVGSGVPLEDLEVAVVLHSGAGRYALSAEAYQARFGVPHPEADLLVQLEAAGVSIYLCGQTAGYRDYRNEQLHPSVDMALSALTVVTYLQDLGWAVIKY